MASINKVILIGNLGRDPEVRYAPSGLAVANMSLATTRSWKDKTSGEKQEEVEWHRVVLYDRQAELAGEYLFKGSAVYIEGRLKTRKWTDKDGVEKYTTEVVCESMQFLGGKSDEDKPTGARGPAASPERGGQRQQTDNRRAPAPAPRPAAKQAPQRNAFEDMDDNIPF
jgi:single-strand DNA-binding protein